MLANHQALKIYRWRAVLIALVSAVLFCLGCSRFLGSYLWWYGLFISYFFSCYLIFVPLRALMVWDQLGPERVLKNLAIESQDLEPGSLGGGRGGVWKSPLVGPLVQLGCAGCLLLALGVFSLKEPLGAAFGVVRSSLLPQVWLSQDVVLRVESPRFRDKAPVVVTLSPKSPWQGEALSIDTLDVIQLSAADSQKFTVSFSVEENNSEKIKKIVPKALLSQSFEAQKGRWSVSVATLLQGVVLPPDGDPLFVTLEVTSEGAALKKNTRSRVPLAIRGVPLPVVELLQSGRERSNTNETSGNSEPSQQTDAQARLNFEVNVTAEIPLSQVQISLRTQSGYRSKKNVAEFINAQELRFSEPHIEVSLEGIPFAAEDTLWVQAIAQTVLPQVVGRSRELVFTVRSPQAARAQIKKLLTEAEALLSRPAQAKEQRNETHRTLTQKFDEALEWAQSLGQQSEVTKSLGALKDMHQKNEALNSVTNKAMKQKIAALLKLLEKENAQEQQAQFLWRLQAFKLAVGQQDVAEKDLLANAKALEKQAQELSQQLLKASHESYLTPEERATVQRLLKENGTARHLGNAARALEQGQVEAEAPNKQEQPRAEASAGADRAWNDALAFLAPSMNIINQARRRAREENRRNLTQADQQLQQLKSFEQKSQPEQLQKSQKNLQELHKLNPAFDQAAQGAQSKNQAALQQWDSPGQKPSQRQQDVRNIQEDIVKALLALQDEEQSEKQTQRRLDGQSQRAEADAMTAQGQHDAGWREELLKTIMDLRQKGESPDSPLLRYLEGRLR